MVTLVHRQRRLVLAGDGHEWREVGALARQVLRELEAGTRRGGIRIDRIVEQPEAVILAHALVLLAHVGDLAQFQRQPHGIECGPPHAAVRKAARNDQQAFGLLDGIAGALIGDIGRRGGAVEQRRALLVVARANLQHRLGQAQPVGAVVGRHHHDLPEDLQAGAEIVAPEGRVRVALERGQGLGHRPGIALDLGFELDRRIRQILALVGLFGRRRCGCERGQQNNERGCDAGADERKHGVDLLPVGAFARGQFETGTTRMISQRCRGHGRTAPEHTQGPPF
jgi:hypothetical protein